MGSELVLLPMIVVGSTSVSIWRNILFECNLLRRGLNHEISAACGICQVVMIGETGQGRVSAAWVRRCLLTARLSACEW